MSVRPSSSQSQSSTVPMRLILHLASPPTEKLLQSPSAESCKQAFMGQLKEADFIRWGNTKRMTGLRKIDQDGIWEGIRERQYHLFISEIIRLPSFVDNFDHYWRVASKVTPTAGPARPRSPSPPPPSSASMHARPPSADTVGPSERDGAYNVRSVPVRVYLPDGPVLQDLVPPVLEDGLLPPTYLFTSYNVGFHRHFKHARTFSFNTYSSPLLCRLDTAVTVKYYLYHDPRICVCPHSRSSIPSGG